MDNIDANKIKYKKMSLDDLIISIDRLSRFKLPEQKYPRVFKEIIAKYLIEPKFSIKNFEDTSPKLIVKIIETIWNGSISEYDRKHTYKTSSGLILMLDRYIFKNISSEIKILMSAKLDIATPIMRYNKKIPQNISLLKELITSGDKESADCARKIREDKLTKFPIEKIVLAEGITEEILLPVFANKLNYNFDKNGVLVIGAGGKSKLPTLYRKLKDKVKIPVIIIMDSDAQPIYKELKKTTNKKDKVIIIKDGEFEDILPKNLIKRSFNNHYYDIDKVSTKDFSSNTPMCENISHIYKSRKIGEFQKAHFAQIIANNVQYKTDISPEISKIIEAIKII